MKLYLYLAAGLVGISLLGGLYFKGRSDGKAVIQAVLDKQREVWQDRYDKQVAETARVQAEWNRIIGERDGLQKKLADATDYGNTLGDRLRYYQRTRICPLPNPAGTSPGTGDPSPQPSLDERIGEATKRVFADCSADAKQLDEVLARYNAAREAYNAQ